MRAMAVVISLIATWSAARAQPPEITDEIDRQVLLAFLGHTDNLPERLTPQYMAKFAEVPERITWEACMYIRMPLNAFLLTGDTKYLDSFVHLMDLLCAYLQEGPDGFQGWYGLPLELFRHPDHPDRKVDVMITSFEVTHLVADFALVVHGDPDLAAWVPAADRYLALAEQHLVPKWEARGNYRDLGEGGGVYITHADLAPTKAHLTQPHNKHAKIAWALVSLFKATGKDEYLRRAIKLTTRFKRCLTLVDDHYSWNYWDPAGEWDIHPDDPSKWKHWINAEHRGGYYSLSVSQAVLMYELGLVFDRQDLDRFVRTQTQVCWNGDYDNPVWRLTNGTLAEEPRYQPPYLCEWLAPFDKRVWEMAFGAPAQFTRLHAKDHSWQGGPVAGNWLVAKYITLPRLRGGRPAETRWVEQFRNQPENVALIQELAYTVEGEGYQAPLTP